MSRFAKKDIDENSKKAILCYIFAPLLYSSIKKGKSKWLEFHYKQGIYLLKYEIVFVILTILFNLFGKVDKKCIHPKLGIEYICGKTLPFILKLIIILMIIVVLYNVYSGIKNVIKKESNRIPLCNLRNNLFK